MRQNFHLPCVLVIKLVLELGANWMRLCWEGFHHGVGLEIGTRGFGTVVVDHPSQVWRERIVGERRLEDVPCLDEEIVHQRRGHSISLGHTAQLIERSAQVNKERLGLGELVEPFHLCLGLGLLLRQITK